MRASHFILALVALLAVAGPAFAKQQLCWFDENGMKRCEPISFTGTPEE